MKYLALLLLTLTLNAQNQEKPRKLPSISLSAAEPQYVSTQLLTFTGVATDAEDGDISANIVWTSSLMGQIGLGASFTRSLSVGNHIITASVTDQYGGTGSANVNVIIDPPDFYIQWNVNKNLFTTKDKLVATVQVSALSVPVNAANVTFNIKTANNKTQTATVLTIANGLATYSYNINNKSGGIGTYYLTITVSKTGYNSKTVSGTFQVE